MSYLSLFVGVIFIGQRVQKWVLAFVYWEHGCFSEVERWMSMLAWLSEVNFAFLISGTNVGAYCRGFLSKWEEPERCSPVLVWQSIIRSERVTGNKQFTEVYHVWKVNRNTIDRRNSSAFVYSFIEEHFVLACISEMHSGDTNMFSYRNWRCSGTEF